MDWQTGFTIRRVGTDPICLEPKSITINADTFRVPANERFGQFSMRVPGGWSVAAGGCLSWSVTGHAVDIDEPLHATLTRNFQGHKQAWSIRIPVRLDLRSTFDPIRHTFPEPNRASVLGDILPDRSIFEQTYRLPSEFLADELYNGLYSDIVFLRRDGPTRGGLCSGMARWAVDRSLGAEPEPRDRSEALQRITTYHGRQLSDRSFLMGIPTFLRGSPRATYRIVRGDLLRSGQTDRAFDIAVPRPWRRDVVQALVSKGHTIVPYRIIQHDTGRATVEVYDPNRPPATLEMPEAIEFDLKRDRYSYRHMVAMSEDNVGLVAARQHGYARQGSAIAAGLASLAMRLLSGASSRRTQSSPAEEPAGL